MRPLGDAMHFINRGECYRGKPRHPAIGLRGTWKLVDIDTCITIKGRRIDKGICWNTGQKTKLVKTCHLQLGKVFSFNVKKWCWPINNDFLKSSWVSLPTKLDGVAVSIYIFPNLYFALKKWKKSLKKGKCFKTIILMLLHNDNLTQWPWAYWRTRLHFNVPTKRAWSLITRLHINLTPFDHCQWVTPIASHPYRKQPLRGKAATVEFLLPWPLPQLCPFGPETCHGEDRRLGERRKMNEKSRVTS